ncbi:hypothetical protein [Dactylosporangium sp. NPDC051541]|uniref:hypothetical protein n=1 Tax=Dactylosporangium sp. NPDC051541 TaxID=3363977 RepID=UPI00379E95FA
MDSLADPRDLDALGAFFGRVFAVAMPAVGRGELGVAFDVFMAAVCGAGYRGVVTAALGAGALVEAERRCRYFFTDEVAAMNS